MVARHEKERRQKLFQIFGKAGLIFDGGTWAWVFQFTNQKVTGLMSQIVTSSWSGIRRANPLHLVRRLINCEDFAHNP